jgi:hypothetical protein
MPYSTKIEKFLVEASLLGIDNTESIDVSRYITDINVKKDFAQSSFPLVVINMMTTEAVREQMQSNDVSMRLKVSKFTDVDGEQDGGDSSVSIDEVVFDTIIRTYTKPFSSTMSKTEDDNEDRDNQRDTVQLIPYQIVGIPEDLIQKNAVVVNEVYDSSKMDDILVNMLSRAETGTIFIDPSDNVERHESLVIPPMNLVPAVKYLQEVYGIYDAGMSLFFDFSGTYLTKLFAQTRQYRNSMEVLTVPARDNSTDQRYTSNQIDEEGNVRLYMNVPPPFVSSEVISLDYVGQTTVFNSYDSGFNTLKRVYEQDTSSGKVRYFWNNYQNEITERSYVNETLRTSQAIMLTMKNISPAYFGQDTLFRVTSDKDYATGDYTLLEMSFSIFTRGDYKVYESVISMKLSKK